MAFVNDGAHDYQLLTCYVDPASQIAALREVGLQVERLIERDGREGSPDSDDTWLTFVAHK